MQQIAYKQLNQIVGTVIDGTAIGRAPFGGFPSPDCQRCLLHAAVLRGVEDWIADTGCHQAGRVERADGQEDGNPQAAVHNADNHRWQQDEDAVAEDDAEREAIGLEKK